MGFIAELLLSLAVGSALMAAVILWPEVLVAAESWALELAGPTAPVLAILGAYSIATIIVAPFIYDPSGLRATLRHANVIAGINWTVGMIGTYLALQASLEAGIPTRDNFSHALVSTLAGLVNMVVVLLAGEFLAKLRGIDLGRDA